MGQPTTPDSAAEESVFDLVWNLLKSVKFAVTIIVLIALGSILGTVLPQHPPDSIDGIAATLRHEWGPFKTGLYISAQLYDVYHSVWYKGLLILLMMSASVCTIDRLSPTLKRMRAPRVAVKKSVFKRLRASRSVETSASSDVCAAELTRHFGRKRYKVFREDSDGQTDLLMRKGGLSLLGPATVHVSLIIIVVAALWGTSKSLGADRSAIGIVEGYTVYEPLSGTYIKCNDFEIELAEQQIPEDQRHTGSPSSTFRPTWFTSNISVFEPTTGPADRTIYIHRPHEGDLDDIEVLPSRMEGAEEVRLKALGRETTEVNFPAKVGDVELFQSSWGLVGLKVRVRHPDGSDEEVPIQLTEQRQPTGQVMYAPRPLLLNRLPADDFGTSDEPPPAAVAITGFTQRLYQGMSFSARTGTAPNPAIRVARITSMDEIQELEWTSLGESITVDGTTITFEDIIYSTTLDARRQPGVWLLMVGFTITGIGVVLCFWLPLREVRAQVVDKGDVRVVLLGAPRSHAGDKPEAAIDRAVDALERRTASQKSEGARR